MEINIKRKSIFITGLVFGIILALGPVWGILATVISMIFAFDELAGASPSASTLAANISAATYITLAGWMLCPVGIGIIIVAAIALIRNSNEDEID